MIETIANLPQEKMKVFAGYSAERVEPVLGITPEALQPVDVYPAAGEVFPVVHAKVSIAAEHERVVDLVSVGVDDVLPLRTFLTVRASTSFARVVGTTSTKTRPSRSRMPKTGTLPAAPLPRFPFRFPPKYDSSTSTSPPRNISPSAEWARMAERIVWTALYAAL
jgi:hypothetical protein